MFSKIQNAQKSCHRDHISPRISICIVSWRISYHATPDISLPHDHRCWYQSYSPSSFLVFHFPWYSIFCRRRFQWFFVIFMIPEWPKIDPTPSHHLFSLLSPFSKHFFVSARNHRTYPRSTIFRFSHACVTSTHNRWNEMHQDEKITGSLLTVCDNFS